MKPRFFDQAETLIDNLGIEQTLSLLAHVAGVKADRFSVGRENRDTHNEWCRVSSDLNQLARRMNRFKKLEGADNESDNPTGTKTRNNQRN